MDLRSMTYEERQKIYANLRAKEYVRVLRQGSKNVRVMFPDGTDSLVAKNDFDRHWTKVKSRMASTTAVLEKQAKARKNPMPSQEEMARHFQFPPINEKDPEKIYHRDYEDILNAVLCGPVLLVGPAGSGKTMIASQIAEALNVPSYFTGAVKDEYSLLGFRDAYSKVEPTQFRLAFEHGGVFLWDEMDASEPDVLVKFNMALANGVADFPDGKVEKHPDFYAIGAANTYGTGADMEYVGRNQLDAATLDRFMVIEMDYDEEMEYKFLPETFHFWIDTVQTARESVKKNGLRHVVSPRASIYGAKLLARGTDLDAVIKMTLLKGMDADASEIVLEAVKGMAKDPATEEASIW